MKRRLYGYTARIGYVTLNPIVHSEALVQQWVLYARKGAINRNTKIATTVYTLTFKTVPS